MTLDFFYDTVMLFPVLHNHMDNSYQTFSRTAIAGLALAGVVSGLLTMVLVEFLTSFPALQESGFGLYVPGAVFAVIVSAYCVFFMRIRYRAKLLGLLAASVIANLVAFKLTIYIILSPRLHVPTTLIFDGALFCGGAVGAFALVASAQLLFSTQRKWVATLKKASLCSLVGGALAILGWELGSSAGKVLWLVLHLLRLPLSDADVQAAIRNGNVNFCSLFVLWQAGMAPVLGWLLWKSSLARSEQQSASA